MFLSGAWIFDFVLLASAARNCLIISAFDDAASSWKSIMISMLILNNNKLQLLILLLHLHRLRLLLLLLLPLQFVSLLFSISELKFDRKYYRIIEQIYRQTSFGSRCFTLGRCSCSTFFWRHCPEKKLCFSKVRNSK